MKEKYIQAVAEVVLFDNSDVISTSACQGNSKRCNSGIGLDNSNHGNGNDDKKDKWDKWN